MATPRSYRRSTQAPATASSNRGSGNPTRLPPYQPPAASLNPRALQHLQNLPTKHNVSTKLQQHLRTASERLGEVVADVNDLVQDRRAGVERAKARQKQRREQEGGDENAGEELEPVDGEEELTRLERKVDEFTGKIEKGVRDNIDSQAKVEMGQKMLGDVSDGVVRNGGKAIEGGGAGPGAANTQSTLGASQFRSRREVNGDDEDDEEGTGNREAEENDPGIGIPTLLTKKGEQSEAEYEALSMRTRYAGHNDYIQFKKLLHYAQNPGDNAPPVPHANTWFRTNDSDQNQHSSQPNSPSRSPTKLPSFPRAKASTSAAAAAQVDDDSASDIEAVSERININCPITLRTMTQPVTSTKCPHSFEKAAFLEMLSHSSLRLGPNGTALTLNSQNRGRGPGIKAMKCPVCEVLLVEADVREDVVLRRNIGRVLKEREKQIRREDEIDDDEDEEEEGIRGSGRLDRRGGNVDGGVEAEGVMRVKAERMQSMVPGTQIEVLDGDDDDDDDDEDEEEEEEEDESEDGDQEMVDK